MHFSIIYVSLNSEILFPQYISKIQIQFATGISLHMQDYIFSYHISQIIATFIFDTHISCFNGIYIISSLENASNIRMRNTN